MGMMLVRHRRQLEAKAARSAAEERKEAPQQVEPKQAAPEKKPVRKKK